MPSLEVDYEDGAYGYFSAYDLFVLSMRTYTEDWTFDLRDSGVFCRHPHLGRCNLAKYREVNSTEWKRTNSPQVIYIMNGDRGPESQGDLVSADKEGMMGPYRRYLSSSYTQTKECEKSIALLILGFETKHNVQAITLY